MITAFVIKDATFILVLVMKNVTLKKNLAHVIMQRIEKEIFNGGGAKHRRNLKGNAYAVYRELRDFPLMREKYRVLCANCNWNSYIKTKNNL